MELHMDLTKWAVENLKVSVTETYGTYGGADGVRVSLEVWNGDYWVSASDEYITFPHTD